LVLVFQLRAFRVVCCCFSLYTHTLVVVVAFAVLTLINKNNTLIQRVSLLHLLSSVAQNQFEFCFSIFLPFFLFYFIFCLARTSNNLQRPR